MGSLASLRDWRRMLGGQNIVNTDTTPVLDPLRTTYLHPPYYGAQAIEHMSTVTALHAHGRSALLARTREKELELQSMYALLNAGVPINQLPIELLVEIFVQIQGIDSPGDFDWTNILRVCRHWFVVGSTAGKLWKNLIVVRSTNLLRTGLARSRNAEVTIDMMGLSTHPLPDAAPFLAPHLHRLRGLRLYKVPSKIVPALIKFMDDVMPALRHFFVYIDPQADELVLDFPPRRFPRLEELMVSRVYIFSDLSSFPQLRVLHFTGCFRSTPTLKTSTFLDALRRLEKVEELILSNVRVCDLGNASPFAGMDSVVLSKLQKLVVTNTEGPLIKQLLSAITIPSDATVSLSAPFQGETLAGNTGNINAFLPEDRRCLSVLTTIVEAHIVMYSGIHSIEGYTTTGPTSIDTAPMDLTLEISNDGLGGDLNVGPEDIIDVFRDSTLESVTLEVSSAIASQVDWQDFFATNPTLRILDLSVMEDDLPFLMKEIFSALDPGDTAASSTLSAGEDAGSGGGEDTGTSADRVLCPDLRSLRLYGMEATSATFLDTAATCLENRRQKLGKPGEHALDDLRLALGLADHLDEVTFEQERLAFSERLAPLVGALDFQVGDFW